LPETESTPAESLKNLYRMIFAYRETPKYSIKQHAKKICNDKKFQQISNIKQICEDGSIEKLLKIVSRTNWHFKEHMFDADYTTIYSIMSVDKYDLHAGMVRSSYPGVKRKSVKPAESEGESEESHLSEFKVSSDLDEKEVTEIIDRLIGELPKSKRTIGSCLKQKFKFAWESFTRYAMAATVGTVGLGLSPILAPVLAIHTLITSDRDFPVTKEVLDAVAALFVFIFQHVKILTDSGTSFLVNAPTGASAINKVYDVAQEGGKLTMRNPALSA